MNTADEIKRLAELGKTANEIAKILNVSRQRIYILAKRDGISLPRYHATRREYDGPKPRLLTGGVPVRIDHSTVGAISELLVAADLMARGWAVFLPVLPSRGHDLIAVRKGNISSFEVRSAHRNLSGELKFNRKADNASDFYGLVVTGEPVQYEPPLPD